MKDKERGIDYYLGGYIFTGFQNEFTDSLMKKNKFIKIAFLVYPEVRMRATTKLVVVFGDGADSVKEFRFSSGLMDYPEIINSMILEKYNKWMGKEVLDD